jgi:hypothetical protein
MRAFVSTLAIVLFAVGAAAADMKHDHGTQGGHGAMKGMAAPATASVDTATTRTSDAGHFKVSIASRQTPVAINRMQAWEVTVLDEAGKPVEGAKVEVDGGMPDHGHGLPTAPRVTKDLGAGKYLVEGVKFNMAGWWQLKFGIDSGQCRDKVEFNLVLN